jgi:hypothetical protein
MSRKNNRKNTTIIEERAAIFAYTIRLEAMLADISDNISHAIIGSHMSESEHGYSLLDLAEREGFFRVHINANLKSRLIGIHEFIDTFFNKKFSKRDILKFIYEYNKRIPDVSHENQDIVDVSPFQAEIFEYKPKDILYTFSSLCYKTYPHGTEEAILKYIPLPLIEDNYGNYYLKVGESDTMFTSHFDSACKEHQKVKLLTFEKDGDIYMNSDGKTILSADDKAGVTVMLYMIENKIPGLYYFFIGEERGGIGSGKLAKDYHLYDHLKGINKCISFDRRNYYSVITHQGFSRCCSDVFAESLCSEFIKYGINSVPDDTGMFTDSANFTDDIPECTNISVGYFNEHNKDEYQNITFLEALCGVCVKVDWANLNVKRKPGINKEIVAKNHALLQEFKITNLYSEARLRAYEERVFVEVKMISSSFQENYEDIFAINELMRKFYKNPYIYFADDYMGTVLMNIELD